MADNYIYSDYNVTPNYAKKKNIVTQYNVGNNAINPLGFQDLSYKVINKNQNNKHNYLSYNYNNKQYTQPYIESTPKQNKVQYINYDTYATTKTPNAKVYHNHIYQFPESPQIISPKQQLYNNNVAYINQPVNIITQNKNIQTHELYQPHQQQIKQKINNKNIILQTNPQIAQNKIPKNVPNKNQQIQPNIVQNVQNPILNPQVPNMLNPPSSNFTHKVQYSTMTNKTENLNQGPISYQKYIPILNQKKNTAPLNIPYDKNDSHFVTQPIYKTNKQANKLPQNVNQAIPNQNIQALNNGIINQKNQVVEPPKYNLFSSPTMKSEKLSNSEKEKLINPNEINILNSIKNNNTINENEVPMEIKKPESIMNSDLKYKAVTINSSNNEMNNGIADYDSNLSHLPTIQSIMKGKGDPLPPVRKGKYDI